MAHHVQEQEAHQQPAVAGEFFIEFGQSTLENWQSEFLQLFSLVVLAAVFIHRGSGESKYCDDRMEQKTDRILKKLEDKETHVTVGAPGKGC